MLDCIEINPEGCAKYCVIWLHGLGADGHDFAGLMPQLGLNQTRFILPHAKLRPVTINFGMQMRAWYDIPSLDFEGKDADRAGIEDSIAEIQTLIDDQVQKGIEKKHIMIAGFSQGGAIALRIGLNNQDLKGVIALSSYLLFHDALTPAKTAMPFLVMHGRQDPVVPFLLGEHTQKWLTEKNYQVDFKAYDMQHEVCPEQILDLRAWLN